VRFDKIVKPMLTQQLIQAPGAAAIGTSVAVTHIAGCRSRLRLPMVMTVIVVRSQGFPARDPATRFVVRCSSSYWGPLQRP